MIKRDCRGIGLALGVAALALSSAPAQAVDQLIPGKIHIVTPTLVKMVAKPTISFLVPTGGSADDPSINGGSLDVIDTGDAGASFTTTLPSAGWKALGNPPGATGYRYRGLGTIADPCKVVLVKARVIKFVCKDDQTLDPPYVGTSGITLTLGGQNYCAEFGGTPVKNETGLLLRKDADAPLACPTIAACCNGDGFLSFETATAAGDCGDITQVTGMNVDLDCSGLYFGGGGNSLPLPVTVPDMGLAITTISSCTVQTATLGAATSSQTGSNRNCTAAGCLFGAPLAFPKPSSTPLSHCVLNRIAAAASGTLDCSSGAETLDLSLSSIIHHTGDTATDPTSTIPGIQPCPICSSGSCIGGLNNGMVCVAGTSGSGVLGASYPTSHDCPPDPMFDIGTLPIAFSLTTGTVTWTATTATNDTEVEPNQNRVFSGFCRDMDITSGFPFPAVQCWENGMAVGPACAQPEETCEQRSTGAFGPNGGGNMTITAIGSASSLLGGPADGTLVSVFSVPPTSNSLVNSWFDLPGPGAVAIPGTAQTCADAMSCP